jgi:hypothetical protein
VTSTLVSGFSQSPSQARKCPGQQLFSRAVPSLQALRQWAKYWTAIRLENNFKKRPITQAC